MRLDIRHARKSHQHPVRYVISRFLPFSRLSRTFGAIALAIALCSPITSEAQSKRRAGLGGERAARPASGPTFGRIDQTIDEDGSPRSFSLTLNAADTDGDSIHWSISGPAKHGQADASGRGSSKAIHYVPDENYNGTDRFTVQISDGIGGVNSIDVVVTVVPRNDPPENTQLPSITGRPRPGSVLSAAPGTWNDKADQLLGKLSYSYQWQYADDASGAGLADIPDATGTEYTVSFADHGKFIRVNVTATDNGQGLPKKASTTVASAYFEIGNTAPVFTMLPRKEEPEPEYKIEPRPLFEPGPEPIPEPIPETFLVSGFQLSGNKAISSSDLKALLSSYVGKNCTLEELREAANKVSESYQQLGLMLARAYLPAQEIREGIVKISILEGEIGTIHVEGNENYSDEFVRSFIRESVSIPPVSNADLERGLLILNTEFEGLKVLSVLERGHESGTVDVRAKVEDHHPLQVSFGYNNFGSDSISKNRYSVDIDWTNAIVEGGTLTLSGIFGDEPNELAYGTGRYSFPINKRGTKIGVMASSGSFDVSQEFASLGLEGESDSGGAFISHPFVKRRGLRVSGEFGIQIKDSKFFILDQVSSNDNIRYLYTTVRTSAEHLGGTSHVSANYSLGLGDALGGLSEDDPAASRADADNGFSRLSLSLARVQRLSQTFSILATASGQVSSDSMVSGEEWQIGGANSVRGFAPGEASGDSGYSSSIELRVTPFEKHRPLAFVGFIDHGYVDRRNPAVFQPKNTEFTGAGLGMRYHHSDKRVKSDLRLDIGWSVNPTKNTLGDDPVIYVSTGFHF